MKTIKVSFINTQNFLSLLAQDLCLMNFSVYRIRKTSQKIIMGFSMELGFSFKTCKSWINFSSFQFKTPKNF